MAIAGFGQSGYTSSTYIQGDFTATYNAAQKLDDKYAFVGKNNDYVLLGNNCLNKTVDLLSFGTLHEGVSADRFLNSFSSFDQVPNNAASKMRGIFYNSAFTKKDYMSQLDRKLNSYESMNGFQKYAYHANWNIFRLEILMGVETN